MFLKFSRYEKKIKDLDGYPKISGEFAGIKRVKSDLARNQELNDVHSKDRNLAVPELSSVSRSIPRDHDFLSRVTFYAQPELARRSAQHLTSCCKMKSLENETLL